MTQIRQTGLRRRAATVGGLVALGVAGIASLAVAANQTPAPGPARGAETTCNAASVPVSDSTRVSMRRSIRCLVNEERAVRGLSRLTRNLALVDVAQRHTDAMVDTGCLTHVCPGEADLETRLRRSGYLDDAGSWRFVENTGCGETAAAMFNNWMASDYHRLNLLEPDLRDVGVGASQDRVAGKCKKDFGTFTILLAKRAP